jgi:hypothetical protein
MQKVIICWSILIASAAAFANDDPVELMRKKIFAESLDKAACLTFPKNLKDDAKSIDPNLVKFLNDLKMGFQGSNAKAMLPLFHPRMKAGLTQVKEILASQRGTLGGPLEASIYMLWALNTVDGSPGPLNCGGVENSNITIWPQFGPNLQVGVWLQIMGQKELGRVFAVLVNKDNQWYLASLHYHQWTHVGKNYEHWYGLAKQDLDANLKPAAYVKLDIAAKLVDGRDQFKLGIYDEIVKAQETVMSKDAFESELRSLLKDWKIVYLSSILAKNGAGIAFRIEVPQEISTNALKEDCGKMAKVLAAQKWFQKLDGFKCSYIMKGEDPSKEGKLGGFYISRDSL